MIRIERDPDFWRGVAEHPEVAPHVLMGADVGGLLDLISAEHVTPIATEHGGFIFVQLDRIGRMFELHTMFTPEGWGREVAIAARQAFASIFSRGARIITTQEVEGWWRSAPPLSHGWKPVGEFAPAGDLPLLRSWILTADAWRQSPVGRKAH